MSLPALLISPSREIASRLGATLAESRAFQILADLKSYPQPSTVEIRLRQLQPEVVLVDVATDPEQAMGLIRLITEFRPPVLVVGLHHTADSAAVIQTLRAGASEFLAAPFSPQEQKEAVARLRRLRQPDQSETYSTLGKVIVFTSAKPGAGSSTLAAHTACAMRAVTGQRILLIDFDLEGGTIAFYLKLQPPGSVTDALGTARDMEPLTWSSLVAAGAGIDTLAAPEQPHTSAVDPSAWHDLLEFARTRYDWIVVDAPSVFHRHGLLALSESDSAYLVSTGDLVSLHLARKAVNMLAQLGMAKERYQVVINRLSRRDGIGGSDIEKIFNSPVFASLPNDYFPLHRVISLGQPLTGDCDLGRALAQLASKISAAGERSPVLAGEQRSEA